MFPYRLTTISTSETILLPDSRALMLALKDSYRTLNTTSLRLYAASSLSRLLNRQIIITRCLILAY